VRVISLSLSLYIYIYIYTHTHTNTHREKRKTLNWNVIVCFGWFEREKDTGKKIKINQQKKMMKFIM